MSSSPSQTEALIARLSASVIDGRARSIRYRQYELQKLHTALSQAPDTIYAALAADTQAASSEGETEFYWAMEALRNAYDSLDFDHELQEEYLLAAQKSNPGRQVEIGLVVLRPTYHTRLYSIIAPISFAIAAGNCVLLELENTNLKIDSLLRELLPNSLDQETFSISNTVINPSQLQQSRHLLVDQKSTSPYLLSKPTELLSSTTARTIAIVDRTTDIEAAAQAIVTARFSFQGTSPYAPDVILVNEFVKTAFLGACTRIASQDFTGTNLPKRVSSNAIEETKSAIKKAEDAGDVVVFSSPGFTFLEVQNRSSPLLEKKITGKYLAIASCSSLTDAVSFSDLESTFLAGYFFGSPGATKFMAQYLDCHISFANSIPSQLLFGPAMSLSHSPSFPHRYDRSQFSLKRPQYASTITTPTQLIPSLNSTSTTSKEAINNMKALAVKPLRETGQGKGHAIGYFEQGLLVGASVVLTVVVPTVTYGSWKLGHLAWGAWGRRG